MRPPHTVQPTWPEAIPSGRFASTIRTDSHEGCDIALIGIPDDTGIILNKGRAGAAEGPAAFRAALYRYASSDPAGLRLPRVFDAGDVEPTSELELTHQHVTAAVSDLLERGLFPIAVGGGHDGTLPFVTAVAEHHGPMAGIYCDAHLDVRDRPGSGMPFRFLTERGHATQLHVQGLSPLSNSQEHANWFAANGGRIDALDPRDESSWPTGGLFASFDLDVVDQSAAPGVSAPNPCGWTPAHAALWCHALGRCPRVRCFDIMELSPPHDNHLQTARLACHLFLAFLTGYAQRPS
ncbi:MAG: arginase family protein [Phycisphaerales bacterium JB040]